MKKPVVDYRNFRLSKINEPEYRHLWLLLGWVGYFLAYFLTEHLIPLENCHLIHSRLDDMIPFREEFVIFYVYWYFLVFGTLLYFILYNVESYSRVSIYIIVTQVVATIVYIVYPNVQDLRPAVFPRENVFTWMMGIIYSADTPSGVCPSLHAAYSFGILSAWLKEKEATPLFKGFIAVSVILICLSILFVKQHSAVDIAAAVPVGILAEVIAYGSWWKKRLKERKNR